MTSSAVTAVLSMIFAGAAILGPTSPAIAADHGGRSVHDTHAVKVLESVIPGALTNTASTRSSGRHEDIVDSEVAGTKIEVPRNPSTGVTIENSGAPAFTVGLPFASTADEAVGDGGAVVAYDNNNGTSTVPVVKGDGTVQMFTTIDGPSAPQRFAYRLTLPQGATLHLDEVNGGAYVLSADGAHFLTVVAPPWAKDAEGRTVKTRYEVDGTTLVQIVDHVGTGAAYPIVADPWWGLQYPISQTATIRIMAMYAGGAGVSAIVAAICTGTIIGIPCGVAAAVVAGIFVIGGAAVLWCDAPGRGININIFWNGFTTCTSR